MKNLKKWLAHCWSNTRNTVLLGKYFTGRTGVRSLIGQKNIISKEKLGETWQKGLTSGAQVLKYSIVYDGDYINIDPKLLNKGGWDYDIIHNPKILIRQTADNLMAAIDINDYYHLNNIHSFAPNDTNVIIQLEYVLSLLNSRLLTWFYQTTTLEIGRVMAQTDIETLELLPIKNVSALVQKPFINTVKAIMQITGLNSYLKDKNKQNDIENLQDKIDMLVYELYGLNATEINMIEDALDNRTF